MHGPKRSDSSPGAGRTLVAGVSVRGARQHHSHAEGDVHQVDSISVPDAVSGSVDLALGGFVERDAARIGVHGLLALCHSGGAVRRYRGCPDCDLAEISLLTFCATSVSSRIASCKS